MPTRAKPASSTCAPLSLSGFDVGHCASLAPGRSCEVSCPAGQLGRPVRYFCFQPLADAGLPPAALLAPQCFPSGSLVYQQDAKMPLQWVGKKGCLSCPNAWSRCTVVESAVEPSDSRCTEFTLDLAAKLIRLGKWGMCVDMFWGPAPGLWKCSDTSDNQEFGLSPSETWPGAHDLCASSGRGRICLTQMGKPVPFFETPPDLAVLQPALDALRSGDNQTFLQQSLAVQTCRARLESGIPDDFWLWLEDQSHGLRQALFATFPVHPGQVRLFSAIVDSFRRDKVEELGLASLIMAVSYVNRGKGIDDAVRFPHPKFEANGNTFLSGEEDRIRKETIEEGEHCGLSSNECNNLLKDCCAGGAGHTAWEFKWPRDPSPSVRQWVHWLADQALEHPEDLWADPREVPWTMGVYIFPAPIAECEWVHDKLIEGQAMEEGARWYKYDSSFHTLVCEAGDERFHPNSLGGIALYGGVCGRLSTLEARKSGCMGVPATVKGEPGHSAGFKLKARVARWTPLNLVTGVPELSYLSLLPGQKSYHTLEVAIGSDAFPDVSTLCLDCRSSWKKCAYAAAGSEDCTQFELDMESKLARRKGCGNMCLDMFGGPTPGVWACSKSSANQNFELNSAGELVISSGRGTTRYRATAVPSQPVDNQCLSCPDSGAECTFELMNSSACSKFWYDEDAKLIKPSTGQCVEMLSGPKPGTRRCNSGRVHQRAESAEEGLLSVTSCHGNLRFLRWPVVADVNEENRCLKCEVKNSACEFAAAGSKDCTLFGYDEDTTLLHNHNNGQCLEVRSDNMPGSRGCQSSWESQHATLDSSTNRLMLWYKKRGMLLLQKLGGGPLPAPSARWAFHGFHEVSCTKSNCHFQNMLGLDSAELFQARHKESALASLEAFNDYQTSGLWPTAHDEARLAASMAHALKKVGVEDAITEPLVAWSLRRNGALYEAWELAAEYPAGNALDAPDQPKRSDLASHQWYDSLSESRIRRGSSTSAVLAAADQFANEHLMAGERWASYPQLRRRLINTLCGALSNGTLEMLGDGGDQCALLRRLANGLGWDEAEEDMLELEVGEGNGLSDAFQAHWEAVAHLVLSGEQKESAQALVEHLLQQLSVGYVNERSQAFWVAHHRLLLRGPYAHLLQLAGALLPQARREELLNSTRAILENPIEYPDYMLSDPENAKEQFMEWLTSHENATSHGFPERAVSDTIDGYDFGDGADLEVMRQLQLDKDEEMELGAKPWDEGSYASSEGFDRFDIHAVLATLLSLHTSDAGSTGELAAGEEPPTPRPDPPAAPADPAGARRAVPAECSGSWEWQEHPGTFSGGYAGGVSSGFGLEGAKAKCIDLGSDCAAVTCSSGGTCTVRRSTAFGSSSSGEITYEKVCNTDPTGAPTPAPTLEPMSATQTELLQYCVADILAR